MYFDSFSDFIAMGKHGLYVWLSYGIFLVIIAWNIWVLVSNRRRCIASAKKTWQREATAKIEIPETE